MIAIYCRISGKKEDGKDTSVKTQKEEGVKFANSKGLQYRFYVDKGISGTKDEIGDRPEFAEMLAAIEKGEITDVYCFDQSRLERNPKIWQFFQFIMIKNDCKFYPSGRFTDLNDPMTKMLTGIVSLTNELYASLTSKKVKLAFKARALEGKTHGMLAYGYEKDEKGYYRINEEQAKIIREIYQLSLEGNGSYTIAKILNEQGIPTKFNSYSGVIKRKDEYTGKETEFKKEDVKWRGNVIHDMIINPLYKGLRKWNDEEISIPAIIEVDMWEKVYKNLQVNKKHVGKREEFKYLLNGLIFCADCGNPFIGKKRVKSKDSAYKCKGKTYHNALCTSTRGINISKIETFIIHHLFINKELEKLLSALPSNPEASKMLKVELVKQQSVLKKIDQRIENLRNLLMDSDLQSDDKIKEAYKDTKKNKENLIQKIDLIQNQLFEAENNVAKTRLKNSIGNYKINTSFESTKKLIHSIIEKITIKHNKLTKGGFFTIMIDYKGFEESSIFFTDWQAMEWSWSSRYRTKAITKEDLKEDFESLKYLLAKKGIDINDIKEANGFKGFETTEGGLGMIVLKKEELIDFNIITT
jgi:site-specific DNA recombinase